MSSNQEKIVMRYQNASMEASRAESSRTSGLEFYYTKKHLEGFISKDSHVLEVGCATGHYGLYYANRCASYLGVDISPEEIEYFQRKIENGKYDNLACQVGDATDLRNLSDESFDVVLCLGPMYHLPPEERDLAFNECRRVCKTGGVLAFAYINKVGAYAGVCVSYEPNIYPSALANENVLKRGYDDVNPNITFFTTPEEIESVAKRHSLQIIKNLATDFTVTMKIVDAMTDEQFELMKPLLDEMSSYASCTGMSNHALLVCKK